MRNRSVLDHAADQPGGSYGVLTETSSQLDLRLSKVFRLSGHTRLPANVDIYNAYNALNGNAILGGNRTYGAKWLLPIAVSTATEPILQRRF
jgi:hypothetical protein